MLQNARVTAFTISELLGENQKGGGSPPTQIRVKTITDCFDDMLEDHGFITLLANGTGYKPNRLKKILKENKPNKRNG